MRNANKVNNSVVEMVVDQAKSGREVTGTVVSLVPDNKEFKVTSCDISEKVVTVTEVLPEDSEAVAEVVELTERNARIAHYINNPNERPVPNATLKDVNGKNILIIEDTEISCGRIQVLKVLGGIKGKVLLLTASENTKDIMAYDVQGDEFTMVHENFAPMNSDVEFYRLDKDVLILRDTLIETVEEKDENGKVTDTYKKLMYNNMYQVDVATGYPSEITLYDEDEEDYVGFPLVSKLAVVEQAGRRDLVVKSNKTCDGNGKISDSKGFMTLYRINRDGYVCEKIASYEVTGKVYLGGASNSSPVITIKAKDKVLITTNRGTLLIDDAEIIDAMKDFYYFDGVYSYEDENGYSGAKWFYSNKERKEICFTSVETDRGTLFELIQDVSSDTEE